MKISFKDLFKDLTWMQIGAGALAAATSFFLSSSIGIAGSLIGAAVGSVVTTFSSTVYKSLFTASDEAIKKKMGVDVDEGGAEEAPAAGAVVSSPADPVCREARSAELYRVRSLAAQRKAKRIERLVAAVSLATGVAAVAVCAAVIFGATDGTGIGYRPSPAPRAEIPVGPDAAAFSDDPTGGPTSADTAQQEEPADTAAGQGAGDLGTTVTPGAEAPDAPADGDAPADDETQPPTEPSAPAPEAPEAPAGGGDPDGQAPAGDVSADEQAPSDPAEPSAPGDAEPTGA